MEYFNGSPLRRGAFFWRDAAPSKSLRRGGRLATYNLPRQAGALASEDADLIKNLRK
jgi:hypothetical protein